MGIQAGAFVHIFTVIICYLATILLAFMTKTVLKQNANQYQLADKALKLQQELTYVLTFQVGFKNFYEKFKNWKVYIINFFLI